MCVGGGGHRCGRREEEPSLAPSEGENTVLHRQEKFRFGFIPSSRQKENPQQEEGEKKCLLNCCGSLISPHVDVSLLALLNHSSVLMASAYRS